MDLGLCTAAETLTEKPDGLDYIEERVQGLLIPAEGNAAFTEKLEAAERCPVPIRAANIFLPRELKATGPDADPAALDPHVHVAVARAERVGIDTIVFGSGGSRQVPEGFDHDEAVEQIVAHLRRWGPLAGAHGVTIVLEPLQKSGCNIVNTVGEGAEIVRRVGHPNIRLLADTYHMAADGDPPDGIADAGELIAHVHCAELEGRARPGTHGEDLTPYWRALKSIGYDGRISIEARWKDMPAELPDALKTLREQIDRA